MIVNPINGQKYPVTSNIGRQVLKKYLNTYKYGGSEQSDSEQSDSESSGLELSNSSIPEIIEADLSLIPPERSSTPSIHPQNREQWQRLWDASTTIDDWVSLLLMLPPEERTPLIASLPPEHVDEVRSILSSHETPSRLRSGVRHVERVEEDDGSLLELDDEPEETVDDEPELTPYEILTGFRSLRSVVNTYLTITNPTESVRLNKILDRLESHMTNVRSKYERAMENIVNILVRVNEKDIEIAACQNRIGELEHLLAAATRPPIPPSRPGLEN